MIEFNVPVKLESTANKREHWSKKAERAKIQREWGRMTTQSAMNGYKATKRKVLNLPYLITITRIGKRKLDSDNLSISGKHLRDGIADALHINDGDETKVEWKYSQKIGKEYAAIVKIESV